MKEYRFFYHYNRHNDGMTVHFRGRCIPCRDVTCLRDTMTKRNKRQPRLVVQGWAKEVLVYKERALIR